MHPGNHDGNRRLHSLDGLSPFGVIKEAELKKVELSVVRKEMYSVKATSASRTVRETASDLLQQIQEAARPTSQPKAKVSDILQYMCQLGIPTTRSSGGTISQSSARRHQNQGQNPKRGSKSGSRPRNGQHQNQNPARSYFTCNLLGH